MTSKELAELKDVAEQVSGPFQSTLHEVTWREEFRQRFTPTTCAELVREVMRLRVERAELGSAIAEAAIKCGIIDGSVPLDGPRLLLICNDLADERERCARIVQRELETSEGRGIDFEDLTRIKNSILGKG